MSYERDEAMRQQEATEAMIRTREPRRSSGLHPDPLQDLIRQRDDLLEALKAITEEVCDYALINNLGDPEQKHNVKLARAAIAKAEAAA